MVIHDVEQNTLPWLNLHIGIPTASVLDQLLDTSFKIRTGEMPKTLLHKKLAEDWRQQPLIQLGSSGSFSTDQGMILEEEARPWFEFTYNCTVKRIGFISTDDGKFGCSPDGALLSDQIGIEIKCPAKPTHVKYLLNGGGVPKEYLAQVHGSMFATGWKRWIFVSYCRNFPPLVVKVERDEQIQSQIKLALDAFNKDFEEKKAILKQMGEK